MCRDGEWSEDKSLGACPKWKLRRDDWVRNRWHSAPSGECASRPLMIVRFDVMDYTALRGLTDGSLEDKAAPGSRR
jgi:hypothetical protein